MREGYCRRIDYVQSVVPEGTQARAPIPLPGSEPAQDSSNDVEQAEAADNYCDRPAGYGQPR